MSEAPKVEPLSSATLAEARGHVADEYGGVLSGQCAACWEPWPCRESRWLATVDAERQRADRAEAEIARLRAALEAAKVLHVEEWSDACPVAVRQAGDRCEDCSSEGLSVCVCPCTCSAETHNAAIDKALGNG